jgi:hypothetical protein
VKTMDPRRLAEILGVDLDADEKAKSYEKDAGDKAVGASSSISRRPVPALPTSP